MGVSNRTAARRLAIVSDTGSMSFLKPQGFLTAGVVALLLAACVGDDPETGSPESSLVFPSTSEPDLGATSQVLCYFDDSLPDGSSWIIEFADGAFASLESIPGTNESLEPSIHRRLGLGTFDDPPIASVRLAALPIPLYSLETWDLTSDAVRRPSFDEPGQDRVGRAVDCADVDLDAALAVLHELQSYIEKSGAELGVVDGSARRVATLTSPDSDRVEVFVDFPGANNGSLASGLNNLLATGRTVVFEDVEFSELVAPSVTRSSSTFWIDTSFLVETKSLGDVAENGGVVLGVLDGSPSTAMLSVEGMEFPIAETVVVETGGMLSGPVDSGLSTLDEAIEGGLLVADRGVELTVSADGVVVGLVIHTW